MTLANKAKTLVTNLLCHLLLWGKGGLLMRKLLCLPLFSANWTAFFSDVLLENPVSAAVCLRKIRFSMWFFSWRKYPCCYCVVLRSLSVCLSLSFLVRMHLLKRSASCLIFSTQIVHWWLLSNLKRSGEYSLAPSTGNFLHFIIFIYNILVLLVLL